MSDPNQNHRYTDTQRKIAAIQAMEQATLLSLESLKEPDRPGINGILSHTQSVLEADYDQFTGWMEKEKDPQVIEEESSKFKASVINVLEQTGKLILELTHDPKEQERIDDTNARLSQFGSILRDQFHAAYDDKPQAGAFQNAMERVRQSAEDTPNDSPFKEGVSSLLESLRKMALPVKTHVNNLIHNIG